ncbi:MAG: carbohydrate-binding family 9-like protein [Armatimonadota bacterium]
MELPVYHCRRIERDLQVTGRIDDPLWGQAEIAVLGDPVDGSPKHYRTEARLLYNATYLYIAFSCEDAYVWGTYTERDAPIFSEECVEVFISPSGKVRQYYELNVSPRNTVFDALILNGAVPDGERNFRSFLEYTCEGMITEVHIDGQLGVPGARGWSAEYAIPHTSIIGADHVIPAPGDEWRINLYRIDSLERDELDLYAWSPPGKEDFHVPWRFGTLRFS